MNQGLSRPIRVRRVARQFYWLFSARLLSAIAQMLMLGLAARLLGPRNFGLLAGVIGLSAFLTAGTDLGVTTYATRARAASPKSRNVRTCYLLSILSSIAVMLISAGACISAGVVFSRAYFAYTPLAVWIATEKLSDFLLAIAIADGETRENVISVLTRRLSAFAIFSAATLVADFHPAWAFAWSSAISGVIGYAYIHRRLGAKIPPNQGDRASSVLRSAIPFWLNSVFAQARALDVIVVAVVASPLVAGIYAVPARLTSPLRMITTTLAQVALPAAARGKTSDRAELRTAFLFAMSGMAVLLGLVAAGAELFVPFFLGPVYSTAITPLQIVVVGLFFAGISSFMNSYLQGTGMAGVVATVTVTTAILALLGVGLGAHYGDENGAALALSLSLVLQTAMLIAPAYRLWRKTSISEEFR